MKTILFAIAITATILPTFQAPSNPITTEQERALNVLTTKCNVCHQIRNPKRVFTADNMNRYAKSIHRQVFVWKRMPKGKDITLTSDDREALTVWLESLK